MKHLPTTVLLDLAEDYNDIAKLNSIPARSDGARRRLDEIDTELLSRVPEGEFMTVYDYTHTEGDLSYFTEFLPVGFEPYTGEDNEYDNHLSLDDFNRQGFYD